MAKNHLSVEVENLGQIRRGLKEAGDVGLLKELKATNKTVAEMVVAAALPMVPRRSGKLAASVKAMASPTSAYGKAGSPARVPYAAAIHWGEGSGNVNFSSGATVGRPARNVPGRPFLWEAADRTINRAVREYEDAIDDLFDRAVRGR
jgi:hypothetical protein